MMSLLTSKFSVLPTYLGSSCEVVLEGGKQFARVGGQLQEVRQDTVLQQWAGLRCIRWCTLQEANC